MQYVTHGLKLNTQLLNTDPSCKIFGSSTFLLVDLVLGTHHFSTLPDSGFKFSFPRFSGSLTRTTLVSHLIFFMFGGFKTSETRSCNAELDRLYFLTAVSDL
jgi:hypothetical protein